MTVFPKPGIQPIRNCDTVRPICPAATDPIAAIAVDSVRVMSKTLPSAIVMVSWIGVSSVLSLPGTCASPAPTAVLIQLSWFYNTSVDYLLGETDEPAPYPRVRK